MKKHKGFILLAIVVIAMMVVGYLMKKDRVVYNYGDTYYVMDYFTIAKFIALFLALVGLVVFGYKKLVTKKD